MNLEVRIQLIQKFMSNKLVNLTSGGSSGILVSNGNLIMEDGSNLLINGDGQITGNVEWDRFYNSSGWIYYGVLPFNGITLGAIQSGAQQKYIIINMKSILDGTPSRVGWCRICCFIEFKVVAI